MKYRETKLIAFLQTFSKAELLEFEKFVISPYFKKGRDVLPLLKVISNHHPDFPPEEFSEETIFGEVYPDTVFGDRKSKDILKTLSSTLLKMAEEFMTVSKLRRNGPLNRISMLEELLDRDLMKYFDPYKKLADDEINGEGKLSGQTLLENFHLEGLNTRYNVLRLDHESYVQHAFLSGDFLSAHLLINLLRIEKLKHLSGEVKKKQFGKNVGDTLFRMIDFEKILDACKESEFFVLLAFHYYGYICLRDDCKMEYYYKAKKTFFDNKFRMHKLEMMYFYSDLLNILNFSYHSSNFFGQKREIYDLLLSCIEDKAYKFTNESFMQPDLYRNVVLNAVYFKDYDTAESFIEKYSVELNPKFRSNMKYYSKAVIAFARSEFEDALNNISKVKYDLANFKIDVKILSMKIFHELGMTEQAYSMIDNFKHFLSSRKDMHEPLRLSYVNFLKYYIRLIDSDKLVKNNEVAFMKNEVGNEQFIAQKAWLEEKIDELA